MTKLSKIGFKTVSIILEISLLLFIILSFCVRFPVFQTFLAQKASSWLSKEWNTVVRIDRVDIAFFNHVYVDGVYVEDLDSDTLFYLGQIELDLNRFSFAFNKLNIHKLAISDGKIYLIKKLGQEVFNYEFIEDYFASDEPKKTTESAGPKISVKNLILTDIDFKYILEYRKDYAVGINFDKLDLKKINLFVENLTIKDERFLGRIKNLSAREKSGFILDNFSAEFDVSPSQLKVKDGVITTQKSFIRIPELNFLTKTWDNYNYFEDSVYMDIRVDKTIASMEDIAYFANDLWGMNQEVYLSGRVKDYVYNLKIEDLYLETGRETILRGNFELPDFRKDFVSIPKQQIAFFQTSFRDLQFFRLPSDNEVSYIDFPSDKQMQRILKEVGLVQLYNVAIEGKPEQFTVFADQISSSIGTVSVREGLVIYEDEKQMLNYRPLGNGISISNVDLAKISGEPFLGFTTGKIMFSGRGVKDKDFKIDKILGRFDYIDMNGYRFRNFEISNAFVTTSEFSGKLKIDDNHAKLAFEGNIRYDSKEEILGTVLVERLDLEKIGISGLANIRANGSLDLKINGFSYFDIQGSVTSSDFTLAKDSISFTFENIALMLDRQGSQEALVIDTDVLNGKVEGILDFEQIALAVQYELSTILPLIIPKVEDDSFVYRDYASFSFTARDANSLLRVIEPKLSLERGTQLKGSMNGKLNKYDFELISSKIKYDDKVFTGIRLVNKIDSNGIDARYTISRFNYNDSLYFENIEFTSSGTNSSFLSKLVWGQQALQGGELNWSTQVNQKKNILVEPDYCIFYIEYQPWRLEKFQDLLIKPQLNFVDNKVEIHDLMFVNGLQYVAIDGIVSNDPRDALEVRISDFDIDVFNKIYLKDLELSGLISGSVAIHNLLDKIFVQGSVSIDDFMLNDNYIGTLDVESSYDDENNKILIQGELFNPKLSKTKTNKFAGSYRMARQIDNVIYPDELDFVLNFAKMDVSLANAFVDEQIASEIQGLLEGDLTIKGSSAQPLISGKLELKEGALKIGLLGTTYRIQGPINITNYGFSVINMPIFDQENNSALLSASIFHENFREWDYNVFLDLMRDGVKRDPQNKNMPARLERFLALNTEYKEGEIFYGKGYVTGNVNIYGNEELVEITANVRSARGTQINFPMYGRAEITEDDFVLFINNLDSSQLITTPKLDFTGVRLNLNIEATPDARLRIEFDDRTGDEINAVGRGRFRITLDELNDLTMTGTFEVEEGEYNFALGVVRKLFKIEPGSTVKWMGDPYDATLNVRTYYLVEANIQDVSALYDREAELRTNARDQIYCYLSLKDRLSKPVLEFDIEAPRATDAGKVAINRIRADYDELTRQFFSLLLMRQFQPLRGSQTAANTRGSNALNELLANQINAVLSQISGNYDLRVRMNDDELTNQSTYELGFASSFLDDRLLISGSFGVSQIRNGATMQGTNPLIGDVNIEYKLNRSGTFRINVFNRSNQFTVIQQHNLGLFTQGVGIYYQESFSGWHDFQLVQYSLDAFRPRSQRRYIRRDSRLVPVPKMSAADTLTRTKPETNDVQRKEEENQNQNEFPKSSKNATLTEEEN